MIVRKTKIDFLKNSEILREIEFSKFGNVRSFECINVEERLIRFKTLRKYRGHMFVSVRVNFQLHPTFCHRHAISSLSYVNLNNIPDANVSLRGHESVFLRI